MERRAFYLGNVGINEKAGFMAQVVNGYTITHDAYLSGVDLSGVDLIGVLAGYADSFTVALAEKDMRLATQLATELGVNAPQAALTRDTLVNARQSGFKARDMASIFQYLQKKKT
jgi:3-hydroxyisobutyrate dehydrogenase-like beta-hydroxyacid dehydrogenase